LLGGDDRWLSRHGNGSLSRLRGRNVGVDRRLASDNATGVGLSEVSSEGVDVAGWVGGGLTQGNSREGRSEDDGVTHLEVGRLVLRRWSGGVIRELLN